MHRGNGGIVEQAETHRPAWFGMMPRRPHGGESRSGPALHHRVDRHAGATGGARGGLGTAVAHDRIAVELHRLAQVGADRQDPLHIGLGMHPAELLDRRHRRRFAQQMGELRCLQRGKHGAQAFGGFRVVRPGIVLQARRMGDQRGGHVSCPSFSGSSARRRITKLNTPASSLHASRA